MKRSGIPAFVIPTTLPKEGHPEIREMIQSGAYRHNGEMYGFYLFTQRDTSVTKARRVFYLIAKELFLSGVKVYCVSLSDLIDAFNAEEYNGHAYACDNVDMVLLTDFYESGAPNPMTPQDSSRLRAWMRNRFEEGKAVSLLSDAPLDRCDGWWPASFLRYLAEHTISIQL